MRADGLQQCWPAWAMERAAEDAIIAKTLAAFAATALLGRQRTGQWIVAASCAAAAAAHSSAVETIRDAELEPLALLSSARALEAAAAAVVLARAQLQLLHDGLLPVHGRDSLLPALCRACLCLTRFTRLTRGRRGRLG